MKGLTPLFWNDSTTITSLGTANQFSHMLLPILNKNMDCQRNMSYVVFLFCVQWFEVVVCFVDTCEIVNYHCLNFLSIILLMAHDIFPNTRSSFTPPMDELGTSSVPNNQYTPLSKAWYSQWRNNVPPEVRKMYLYAINDCIFPVMVK